MREIRFRGKRLDNDEWVYGSLVRGVEVDDPNNVTWWIFEGTTAHQMHLVKYQHPVDPSTVGQYTGLKDRNGRDIYEGDVVGAFCDTQRFEIKYCEERGGYFLDSVVLCGGAEPAPECLGNLLDTVEVIGNIHDNPELLKEVVAEAREGEGMSDKVLSWLWLPASSKVEVGQTLTAAELECVSLRALDALQYARGAIVCRIDSSGKVLAVADATTVLHEFMCWSAEQALLGERESGREPDERSWAAIETKRKWLRGEATDEKLIATYTAACIASSNAAWGMTRSAIWSATWGATGRAAWDAANTAARKATWLTPWTGAWDVAWDAADAAAWTEVGDATSEEIWKAAWDAAWSAAWDAQAARLEEMLTALLEDVGGERGSKRLRRESCFGT